MKAYHENGTLSATATFIDGKNHGVMKKFHNDGSLKAEMEYENGRENGYFRFYYPDGRLHEETFRVNGKMNGKKVRYYENGQLSEDGDYKNGLKHGILKMYNEDGTYKVNHNYTNDKLDGMNDWYWETGKMKTSGVYENGIINGVVRRFNQNGVLEKEEANKNGKKNGLTKELYVSTGATKWEKTYVDGALNGRMKLFSKDGTLLADFIYRDSVIEEVTAFNFDGNLNGLSLNDYEEKELLIDLAGLMFCFEKFEDIEALAKTYRSEKTKALSGHYKLDLMYDGIDGGFGDLKSENEGNYKIIIRKWQEKSPDSITMKTVTIRAYTSMAWKYRGGGYSKSVSIEGGARFEEYLYDAYKTGEDAMLLSEKDPRLYANMITVGMGLGFSKRDFLDLLELSREHDPDYYRTYMRVSNILLPRWYGDKGEVEGFAQWSAETSKEHLGNKIYALIAMQVKSYVGNDNMKNFNFSWEDMKKGFNEFRADYPEGFKALNYFAWFASYYKDKATARELFEEIGERWDELSEDVWDKKSLFDNYRVWAREGDALVIKEEIHENAIVGDAGALNILLKEGADINKRDMQGRTPLHLAIENGNIGVALFLIEKDADLELMDNERKKAVHYAASNGSVDLFEKIISKVSDISQRDKKGYVPVHYAAYSGFLKIIKIIASQEGFDINAVTNWDRTPLSYATDMGHRDTVKYLLDNQFVLVNIPDSLGRTALNYAAAKGYLGIVKMLVENKADKNLADNKGKMPADYAKENGYDEVYDFLMSQ